jgi:hypothetical protein
MAKLQILVYINRVVTLYFVRNGLILKDALINAKLVIKRANAS